MRTDTLLAPALRWPHPRAGITAHTAALAHDAGADRIARRDGRAVDELTPGQRVIVSLWQSSHRELPHHPSGRALAEAAAHAVLGRLRHACPTTAALWRHYEAGNAADFALIASLVPSPPLARTPTEREQPFWTIREAALWLRWQELTGGAR